MPFAHAATLFAEYPWPEATMPAVPNTDPRVRPWYTQADLKWLAREDAGVKPNGVPTCRAFCQGCGIIIRDCSGSIALCAKCDHVLAQVPLFRNEFYNALHRHERNRCGQHLVDPSEGAFA